MKKTIAVIFGGKSAEHDVSIITAHNPIIQSLIAIGDFDVLPIYISKNGIWYSDKAMNDLAFFKQNNFESKLSDKNKINISLNDGLWIIWNGILQKKVKIDIAFPAMHGTYGEDGSLMGLLRMANIPFVGCDMFASAVAMDKVLTKQIVSTENIPIVPYVWFTKYDWKIKKAQIKEKISKLKLPFFIKPVHLGSSIGISKIKIISELENAIEVAFHYDDKVLVEEGVENLIEVTLPIIGNSELQFAGIERPLNKTEFFDFSEKYLAGGKKSNELNNSYSEIPAKISDDLSKQVLDFGQRTYKALGCSGIARIDFLINSETKQIYMNEVNTLPGSLYIHNWKKVGVSAVELIKKLINFAEERYADNSNITHTFNSSILEKNNNNKIG